MPRLLIDLTHGEEIQPDFTGDNGLSMFKSALNDHDFVIGHISRRADFNIDRRVPVHDRGMGQHQ